MASDQENVRKVHKKRKKYAIGEITSGNKTQTTWTDLKTLHTSTPKSEKGDKKRKELGFDSQTGAEVESNAGHSEHDLMKNSDKMKSKKKRHSEKKYSQSHEEHEQSAVEQSEYSDDRKSLKKKRKSHPDDPMSENAENAGSPYNNLMTKKHKAENVCPSNAEYEQSTVDQGGYSEDRNNLKKKKKKRKSEPDDPVSENAENAGSSYNNLMTKKHKGENVCPSIAEYEQSTVDQDEYSEDRNNLKKKKKKRKSEPDDPISEDAENAGIPYNNLRTKKQKGENVCPSDAAYEQSTIDQGDYSDDRNSLKKKKKKRISEPNSMSENAENAGRLYNNLMTKKHRGENVFPSNAEYEQSTVDQGGYSDDRNGSKKKKKKGKLEHDDLMSENDESGQTPHLEKIKGQECMYSFKDDKRSSDKDGAVKVDGTAEEASSKEKKKKDKRKKEEQKNAGTGVVSGTTPDSRQLSLQYIRQWHADRSKWYFQKRRQTWLLQNMYNCKQVPENDFQILLPYLEGLMGRAREVTVKKAEELLATQDEHENSGAKKMTAEEYERVRQLIQLLS